MDSQGEGTGRNLKHNWIDRASFACRFGLRLRLTLKTPHLGLREPYSSDFMDITKYRVLPMQNF